VVGSVVLLDRVVTLVAPVSGVAFLIPSLLTLGTPLVGTTIRFTFVTNRKLKPYAIVVHHPVDKWNQTPTSWISAKA
jgi:hypothetical protein